MLGMAVVEGDEFRIPISVDDKASAAFNQLNARAKKAVEGLAFVGKAAIALNQSFALLERGFHSLTRASDLTIGSFARFEDALIGVGKTANLTDQELDILGDRFQDLSQEIPVSTNELLELGQVAGQLGVKGSDNILKFSETMAKLAVASDVAGEVGAKQIARILNITDGGVQNIDRFSASLVELGNSVAAGEAEIAKMANEVARAISVFDPASDEILGISAAMKEVGIQAQLGGSAVGRAFREIDAAIEFGGNALRSLEIITGKTGDELRKTFETDATEVFESFIIGLNRIKDAGGSVTLALEQLNLKGDEINKVIPVLANSSEKLTRALELSSRAYEENIALNEEAERAFNSLSRQWTLLINTLVNGAVDITSNVSKDLKEFIKLLRTDLIDAINDTKEVWKAFVIALKSVDFQSINEGLKNFGVALGIALAPLLIPALGTALASIVTFFTAVGGPMLVVVGQFLLFGAALDIIIRNFDLIKKSFILLWQVFVRGMKFIMLGWLRLHESITETRLAVSKFLKLFSATKTVQKDLDATRKRQLEWSDSIDESTKNIEELSKELGVMHENVDPGFFVNLFNDGQKFLESFNKELENTNKQLDKVSEAEIKAPEIERPDAPDAERQFQSVQLFSDDDVKLIQGAFGQGAADFASSMNSVFGGAILGMAAAANVFLDAIQGLIDLIPGLLDKVAGVFDSLTNLPETINKSLIGALDAITNFVGNFVSNVVDGAVNLLENVVEFFFTGLPEAIGRAIEKIPEALLNMFDRLPNLVEKLIIGLARSAVAIFAILPVELSKASPAIIFELVKAAPLIGEAIVNGIIIALKESINTIAGLFGFDEIFNLGKLEDEIKSIGDNIQRSTSNLFQVLDEEAGQRGLDLADRIRNAIASSTNQSVNLLQKAWDALLRLFNWINENIFEPFWMAIDNIWKWVRANIIDPLVGGLERLWNFVKESVVDPLINGLESAFNFVVDNVIKPLESLLSKIFSGIKNILDPIMEGFRSLLTGDFSGLSSAIKDAFTSGIEGIGKMFADMFNPLINLMNNLEIPAVTWSVSAGRLGKWSGTLFDKIDLIPGNIAPIPFQTGGLVPDQESPSVFSRGTDTVDAVLTPGEFVVNREAARNNITALRSINNNPASRLGDVQAGETQVSVIMNVSTNLTKESIRRDIVPEMERELKRKSQAGAFVISQRGIRS